VKQNHIRVWVMNTQSYWNFKVFSWLSFPAIFSKFFLEGITFFACTQVEMPPLMDIEVISINVLDTVILRLLYAIVIDWKSSRTISCQWLTTNKVCFGYCCSFCWELCINIIACRSNFHFEIQEFSSGLTVPCYFLIQITR
jgi:hypothetical protein